MKIGLCLAYKGVNYGMLLQAYATQQTVEALGYQTEILDYMRTDYKHIRFTPWLPAFFIDDYIRKKKFKKSRVVYDKHHQNNIDERKKVSNSFIQERLKNQVKIKGIIELEKKAYDYNGVIVGSDQIWPPDAAFGNFTTLRFVPDEINKISYATSLGVSSYPLYCRSSAAQFWKRFNHLSVREQKGKEIIQSICDVPVQVVLDPTYLLSREQWLERIPNQRIVDEKYILCYFLGGNGAHKEMARKLADKMGYKLVSILSTESTSDLDFTFSDQLIEGQGPETFVNLVRNAELVLTDSFHGVCFSVINNKQFYAFYRTKVGSKNSRNSRIDNILNMWNLPSRVIHDDDQIEDIDFSEIDYQTVNEIVSKKRQESLDYLIHALGDCK